MAKYKNISGNRRLHHCVSSKQMLMRTRIAIALGAIAGFSLGAISVQVLNVKADGEPPVYLISEIDVKDQEFFEKEVIPRAWKSMEGSGGRIIMAGGESGGKPITSLSGTPPKRVVIQVWDNLESLKKWYYSAPMQAVLKFGAPYATWRRYAVEGR